MAVMFLPVYWRQATRKACELDTHDMITGDLECPCQYYKQLCDEAFVISRKIKIEVGVC